MRWNEMLTMRWNQRKRIKVKGRMAPRKQQRKTKATKAKTTSKYYERDRRYRERVKECAERHQERNDKRAKEQRERRQRQREARWIENQIRPYVEDLRRHKKCEYELADDVIAKLTELEFLDAEVPISGGYTTKKLTLNASLELFKILAEDTLIVRIVSRFFGGVEVMNSQSVRMWAGEEEQLAHADALFPQYVALIIHFNEGKGTRFCDIPSTLGEEIKCLSRDQMLMTSWGCENDVEDAARSSGVSSDTIRNEILERFKSIWTEGPDFFRAAAEPEKIKKAGTATLFLPDICHFGPAASNERMTMFTTLRPKHEIQAPSFLDDVQFHGTQLAMFIKNKKKKNQVLKNLRNMWKERYARPELL